MTAYTVTDKAGRILKTGHCPDDMVDIQPAADELVFRVDSDELNEYIDVPTGAVIQRPTMLDASPNSATIAADGVQAFSCTLPVPTTVYVAGGIAENLTVLDGSLSLTFDTPGTYTVRLESFPYKTRTITINAT